MAKNTLSSHQTASFTIAALHVTLYFLDDRAPISPSLWHHHCLPLLLSKCHFCAVTSTKGQTTNAFVASKRVTPERNRVLLRRLHRWLLCQWQCLARTASDKSKWCWTWSGATSLQQAVPTSVRCSTQFRFFFIQMCFHFQDRFCADFVVWEPRLNMQKNTLSDDETAAFYGR